MIKSQKSKRHRSFSKKLNIDERLDSALQKATPPSLQRSGWYTVLLTAIKTLGLILFYYSFSISLTFYNKWLFSDFKYPLSVTIYHLTMKFVIAIFVRNFMYCFTSQKPITLNWSVFVKNVVPTGLTTAFDIGLSNWSLLFITVQLYTMTKSTAIIFVLLFGIVFKLQDPHLYQVLTIFFISGGLFLFTFESTSFNLEGFLLVVAASCLSGVRWALCQILTQKEELGLKNPVDTVYHLQPVMILGLLPLAVAFEGVEVATSARIFGFQDPNAFIHTFFILSAGAGLAFMLGFSEYLLVSKTSGLTLAISGIFKEICTLYIAIEYTPGQDKMSALNKVGMVICLTGISFHVILKAISEKNNPSSRLKTHPKEDTYHMLQPDGQANVSSDEDEIFTRKQVSRL